MDPTVIGLAAQELCKRKLQRRHRELILTVVNKLETSAMSGSLIIYSKIA